MWKEIEITREGLSWLRNQFRRAAKWLADENIHPSIVEWMPSEGMNVRTVEELGLKGKDDNAVFASARKLDRMILTSDGRAIRA